MSRIKLLLAMSLLAVPCGCSFIDSSESISDSISGSSESISKSSGSSSPSDDHAYRNDIRDYTYAYVISGGNVDTFRSNIGRIAERRGVTNWESDSSTWVGIGEGLAKARVSRTELEVFKRNFAQSDPTRMSQIQKGYDSVHPS